MEKEIVRMFGVDLHGDKELERELTKIKGVGINFSRVLRRALGFNPKVKVGELSEEELKKVEDCILHPEKYGIPNYFFNRRKDLQDGKDKHLVAGELELAIKRDIEFLKDIRCYRGVRHMFNYKCRGQRTKSRGANVRGRTGKTVGVSKKKK